MCSEYDFDHAVGYIVQVREKRDAYGSEQYLVRHPNGELHTHENQSFWLLNEEHQGQALALFAQKPTEEGERYCLHGSRRFSRIRLYHSF